MPSATLASLAAAYAQRRLCAIDSDGGVSCGSVAQRTNGLPFASVSISTSAGASSTPALRRYQSRAASFAARRPISHSSRRAPCAGNA